MEQVKEEPLVVSVPKAGEMAGLSSQAAYAAARRGFIPTIPLGTNRKLVPLAKWRAILAGDATAKP